MFKAFGIERADHGAQWTGEAAAQGSLVATLAPANGHGAGRPRGRARLRGRQVSRQERPLRRRRGLLERAPGEGRGEEGQGRPRPLGHRRRAAAVAPRRRASAAARRRVRSPKPAATMAAPASPPAKAAAPTTTRRRRRPRLATSAIRLSATVGRRRGPGQLMRKIFVRHATISSDPTPAVPAAKIALARAAVEAAPDERGKHKELAKLLALGGQLDELGETLEKWSVRDPLDADVIVGRADLAARRGDRETLASHPRRRARGERDVTRRRLRSRDDGGAQLRAARTRRGVRLPGDGRRDPADRHGRDGARRRVRAPERPRALRRALARDAEGAAAHRRDERGARRSTPPRRRSRTATSSSARRGTEAPTSTSSSSTPAVAAPAWRRA